MNEPEDAPALVGINHVALEVGDVEEALAFLGAFGRVTLRGRGPGRAFVDMGDQFLALTETAAPERRDGRHFGLVVSDKARALALAEAAGAEVSGNRVRDPWGNLYEIVDYADVQFSKAPGVLSGMGLGDLSKTAEARRQLAEKGLGEG